MTWEEAKLSLLLLAERRVGAPARIAAYAENAVYDQKLARLKRHVSGNR